MKKPQRPKASDPFDYAKAIYEARLLLTRRELERVAARAAKRAHRAAENAKLRFMQSLFDEVEKVRRSGGSVDDARKAIRAKLSAALNRELSDKYVDLAVRNNMQAAYNFGKVGTFLEPAIREARPFWLYDAVMDMRTSPFCARCHRTLLPAGDRWFMRRIPPNHHNCRSTIRALTKRQAAAMGGVTSNPPRVQPPRGWGHSWVPSTKGLDRALVKVYRSRR